MIDDADAVLPIEVEVEMALRRDDRPLADRTAPLVELLRSGDPIPPEVRDLLADILDQNGGGDFVVELKRRRRGRVPPIFPKIRDHLLEEIETAEKALTAAGAKASKRRARAAVAEREGLSSATVARYARAARQRQDK